MASSIAEIVFYRDTNAMLAAYPAHLGWGSGETQETVQFLLFSPSNSSYIALLSVTYKV